MADHYQTLGIKKNAGSEEIKKAFKRLAVKYHPDKNPDNQYAEDKFKAINQAYQVLSDPSKKYSYDQTLLYNYQASRRPNANSRTTPAQPRYTHSQKRPFDYDFGPYGKYNWRKKPQYEERLRYKIDREYFKNQLITLGIVFMITSIVIGGYRFSAHLEKQKSAAIKKEQDLRLENVGRLFDNQFYEMAFDSLLSIISDYPAEPRFSMKREQLVQTLKTNANDQFQQQQFNKAAQLYHLIIKYQRVKQLETFIKVAECHKQLANYENAAKALDYVLIRNPENISLNLEIGNIYLENIKDPARALPYFDKARKVFRDYQTSLYGKAFELVMKAEDAPEIYYDVFSQRAKTNLSLLRYEEAIKDCNWALFLKPDNARLYLLRANCKLQLGQTTEACEDLGNAIQLGFAEAKPVREKYCPAA